MVDFGIKRLHMDDEGVSRVYHLFDRDGTLKMVADFASPWLSPEHSDRYVHFADSSGKMIAQMELGATAPKLSGARQSKDHAIVVNHAVYAIVSEYQWHSEGEDRIYFVVRVAESLWLVLKEEGDLPYFTIYDEVPANFISRSMEPLFSDLPEPVGEIHGDLRQYDYTVTWQEERIERLGLLVLAVVFLINRLQDV